MPRITDATALFLGGSTVTRVWLGGTAVWAADALPLNIVLPSITGGPYIGDQLEVDTGTWSNDPTAFEYEWLVAGVVVGTDTTYIADEPGVVTCRVTATNVQGSGVATANGVDMVSPPGTFTTFAPGIATMAIEPGGMVAHKINNTDPPHYGHCTTAHAITGKAYIEVLLTFDAPYGNASVFHFYGGTRDPSEYPVESSIGWWWDEPGAAIGITSEWTAILYANRNLPGEIGNSSIYAFTRNPMPVTRRFIFCVDADTRSIWFRTDDGPEGWVGGGDPVTGTNPTVVLGGTAPIRAGATSARVTNVVEMVNPDIYVGPVPTGYTRGIRTLSN